MLRSGPKRFGAHFGGRRNARGDLRPSSPQHDKEKIMPTYDLYLPPKAYTTWRRKEPVHPVAAAVALIARWLETARQRRVLAALDDRLLRDIGITRVDAMREAEKPFWR